MHKIPTMYALRREVAENIAERVRYDADAEHTPRWKYDTVRSIAENGDAAHEAADGAVPVYTSDLLALAADDIALAVDVPELGPAFDGESTPVNIIAANVYDALYEAANEALAEYDAETLDDAEREDEPWILAYEAAHEFYYTDPDSPARVLAEAFAQYRPVPIIAIARNIVINAADITDAESAESAILLAPWAEWSDPIPSLLAAYEAGRTATNYTPPALAEILRSA